MKKKTEPYALPSSALRISAVHNDIPFIRKLIQHEVPLNQANDKGYTALHLAVLCGRDEVVELLLNAGANPNTQEKLEKRSPIFDAARLDHHLIASILLNNKANPEVPNAYGNTPIICAAKEGHIPLVYLLARKGAKVDVLSDDKQGVIACMRNKTEEIALFVKRKGAPDKPAGTGKKNIHLTIDFGASIPRTEVQGMIGIIAQAGKVTVANKKKALAMLNGLKNRSRR
jgi:ankyrin repeat protein